MAKRGKKSSNDFSNRKTLMYNFTQSINVTRLTRTGEISASLILARIFVAIICLWLVAGDQLVAASNSYAASTASFYAEVARDILQNAKGAANGSNNPVLQTAPQLVAVTGQPNGLTTVTANYTVNTGGSTNVESYATNGDHLSATSADKTINFFYNYGSSSSNIIAANNFSAPQSVTLNSAAFAPSISPTSTAQTITTTDATYPKQPTTAAYDKIPLGFEANQGQTDNKAQFLARGRSYNLFLTADASVILDLKPGGRNNDPRVCTGPAILTTIKQSAADCPLNGQGKTLVGSANNNKQTIASSTIITGIALKLSLVGANTVPTVAGQQPLTATSNYFRGSDSSKWIRNVAEYGRVTYTGVYSGVDMSYYGTEGNLEYDFNVAPHVDPGVIILNFSGSDRIELSADGKLTLYSGGLQIQQFAPIFYQYVGGVRKTISGKYVSKGTNQFGFVLGDYDHNLPLVIDPILAYSTFLAGSADNYATGIAVDTNGNIYVTGSTSSTNFPTVSGLYTQNGGSYDVFVTELNASGTTALFSTYFGGSGDDEALGIALDSSNNIYLTGYTSGNFPTTTGAYQTTSSGNNDAFAVKLNAGGSALSYSTYLGGSSDDRGRGIAVDGSGNAYVVGSTYSSNFPDVGTYAKGYTGGENGFVVKLNADGKGVGYATYLGGNKDSQANKVAVDANSNAYVVGLTLSTNFTATTGAYQSSNRDPYGSGFAIKLNSNGSVNYATYLGGSFFDNAEDVAVNTSGNAYITGVDYSGNFTTTTGVLQPNFGGGDDAFVIELNSTGTNAVYSTYLGGSGYDDGYCIRVDSAGNTYVAGLTKSTNFITTTSAYQPTYGSGTSAAFVTKLNPGGTQALYSTYLGSDNATQANGIAVDTTGNIYVTGQTTSTTFPVTTGTYQTNYTGSQDAFITKIGFYNLAFTTQPTGAVNGVPLTTPAVVTVQNQDGSAATGYNGPITLTIQSATNTNNANLKGYTVVNAISGTATFNTAYLDQVGNNYALNAAIGGAGSNGQSIVTAGSTSFNVAIRYNSVWDKQFIGGFTGCDGSLYCPSRNAVVADLVTANNTWETSWNSHNPNGSNNPAPFGSNNNSEVSQLAYGWDGNTPVMFALSSGILWSTPDGINWIQLTDESSDITRGNHGLFVQFAITDQGHTIFAAITAPNGRDTNRVSVSRDGGHTFNTVYTMQPQCYFYSQTIDHIAVSSVNSQNVWFSTHCWSGGSPLAVYGSTDGGATFQQLMNGSGNLYADPALPNRVYVSISSGIYRLDGFSSQSNPSLFASYTAFNSFANIRVDRNDSNTAWVADGNNLYKTTNGGTSWYTLTVNVPNSTSPMLNPSAIIQSNDNSLWVSSVKTSPPPSGYSGGVYIAPTIASSSDGGLTWTDQTLNLGSLTGMYSGSGPNFLAQLPALLTPGGPDLVGHTVGNDGHCSCGDPVNPANGNFFESFDDLNFPRSAGSYLGLDIQRTYNSRDNSSGLFGRNWHSSYDMSLITTTADSYVVVVNPNGRRDSYTPNADGSFSPPSRANATLTHSGNTYTLTTADQIVYTFDAASGKLKAIADRNNNGLNLTYSAIGMLSTISDNYGRVFTLTPTSNGRLIAAITDNTGRTVGYGYDTTFTSLQVVTDTRGFTTTFGYDSKGLLSQRYDQNANLVLQNYYDAGGRVISQTTYAGNNVGQTYTSYFDYNTLPGQTIYTNTLGNRTIYNINQNTLQPTGVTDAQGNLSGAVLNSNDLPTTATNANNQTISAAYNAFGKPTNITTTVIVQGTGQTINTSATYNANNDPTRVTDGRGNSTYYHYTSQGNADIITDTLGQVTTYSYNGQGRVTSTTSVGGMTTTYAYDNLGHTTAMTQTYSTIVSGSTSPVTRAYRTDYTYTPQGWLYTQTDRYDTTSVPSPLPLTSYQYDPMGHVLTTTNQLSEQAYNLYDAKGRVISTTTFMGQTSLYGYDWQDQIVTTTQVLSTGNLVSLTAYDQNGNVLSRTDPKGVVTSYGYDTLNRLITTTVPLLAGGVMQSINGYDAVGNVITSTKTNSVGGVNSNEVTLYQYDGLNRLVTTTVGAGVLNYQTVNIYDKVGNVVQTAQSIGSGLSVTNWNDPAQVITSATTYDALNRPLYSTTNAYDPNAHTSKILTTSYSYDDVHNLRISTDPYGIVSMSQSDPAGRGISNTVTPAPAGGLIASGAQTQTSYNFYDANGLLFHSIDAAGNWTDNFFDSLHRTIRQTRYTGANGTGTPFTSYTYYADQPHPIVTTISPSNVRQDSVSDEAGRLTSSTVYTGTPQAYPAFPSGALTTNYSYDGQGNRISVTDPNGHVTNYGYENTGWLRFVTQTVTSQGSLQTLVTAYNYDGLGNRLNITDANSHVVTSTYDVLNRVIVEYDALGHNFNTNYDGLGRTTTRTDANLQQTSYTYDNASRLLQMATTGLNSNPSITTTYSYNNGGMVLSMADQVGSNPVTTTTYNYDGLNRPVGVTNSNGIVQYGYDVLGRRSSLAYGPNTSNLKAVGYSYDGLSRPVAITNWNNQNLGYAYNGERLTQMVYPNNITATYGYDGANRLTSLAHLNSSNTTILGVSYNLDKLGNRLTANENVNGVIQSLSYSYDELSRLTTETTSQSSSTYVYDSVGNRSQMQTVAGGNTLTTNYSYDNADRLLTTDFNSGTSTTSYSYDATSNLITETATGTGSYVTGYGYDSRNRLSSWQKTGGTNAGTATFSYDGANTRLAMIYKSITTTNFLQDTQGGLPVVLQETVNGSNPSSYLYPLGSTTPLYQSNVSGTNSWYHSDGLGSVRAMTDGSSGAVQNNYNYSAFGASVGSSGSASNSHQFTGEQFDPTGLYYNRARYYNPNTGRFISRDTFAGSPNNPLSQNRFTYAQDDPTLLTDASGMTASDPRCQLAPSVRPPDCLPNCDLSKLIPCPIPPFDPGNPGGIIGPIGTRGDAKNCTIIIGLVGGVCVPNSFQPGNPGSGTTVAEPQPGTGDTGNDKGGGAGGAIAALIAAAIGLCTLLNSGLLPTDRSTEPHNQDVYIYRRGNLPFARPKDVALRREDDWISGLSFSTAPDSPIFLKYSVKKLLAAGYNVRFDKQGDKVTDVHTGKEPPAGGIGSGKIFGSSNHVTVWLRDLIRWDNWWAMEKPLKGISPYVPTLETNILFNLRE